jgi:HlyD family secretion protein
VFRVAGGVVERRQVKTGRQNGLEAEIIEGLAEGDQVILHPSDQIEPGIEVIRRQATPADGQ